VPSAVKQLTGKVYCPKASAAICSAFPVEPVPGACSNGYFSQPYGDCTCKVSLPLSPSPDGRQPAAARAPAWRCLR
jgi:hypothetical protein